MFQFTPKLAAVVQEWDKVISVQTPHGKSLSERVVLSEEEGAFLRLSSGDGESVYGYFKRQTDGGWLDAADYLLSVVGDMIVSCDCPDYGDRKRPCKHTVWLALLTEFGLPSPSRQFLTRLAVITTANTITRAANHLTENDMVTRRIAPRRDGFVDRVRARAARPRPAIVPSTDLEVSDFK